jgi:hypothetical protein
MGISTFKKSKEFGPFFAGYLADWQRVGKNIFKPPKPAG